VLRVGGALQTIDVPVGVQWITYRPVTQMVQDQAQDDAGRPSRLGQVVSTDINAAQADARKAARVDFLAAIDIWAAEHRARIVAKVDVEGLDEPGCAKAQETGREAVVKGLAAVVARAMSLPQLAARARKLERMVNAGDVKMLSDVMLVLLDGQGRSTAPSDMLVALNVWAEGSGVRVEIDVDGDGLDEDAFALVAETARADAMRALAGAAAHATILPGLAKNAEAIRRLATSRAPELLDVVGSMLELPRPLTEDDLDDEEYRALVRSRRWGRDVMVSEARQTAVVEGGFDALSDAARAEVIGTVARLRMFGPPKGGPSSRASG